MRVIIQRSAVVTALLTGATLRTIQFGARTSLSSDESALALNVMDRGWRDLLLRPLEHDQVAPAGFLFLEKASVAILGTGELAFRLFPYLFSIVSLVLFYLVSRRYLRPPAMLAALLVFAISPLLVLYAGTAKQYSGDIAVTLFLLWISLWYREKPTDTAHAAVIGIAGGGALLLSQPGVLVAFGLGALLVLDGLQGSKPVGQLVAIGVGWMVGAAITTYQSLTAVASPTMEYMKGYWGPGFMPPPWVGKGELLWIPVQLARITSSFVPGLLNPRVLPEAVLAAYAFLLLLGVLGLLKRESRNAVLLAVPVILAILAAAVRLLPMAGRVSLFLAPTLLIAWFAGLDRIGAWLSKRLGTLTHTATLGLAVLSTLVLLERTPPPTFVSQTKPALQEVKAHRAPEDQLVVSGGRWTPLMVEYYGRRLRLGDWTHIDGPEGAPTEAPAWREYLRGVDVFRGVPRVWFYLTQACQDQAIMGYLTAIGKRLHSVDYRNDLGETVFVRLYDLSDSERLGRADADTYRLPQCAVSM